MKWVLIVLNVPRRIFVPHRLAGVAGPSAACVRASGCWDARRALKRLLPKFVPKLPTRSASPTKRQGPPKETPTQSSLKERTNYRLILPEAQAPPPDHDVHDGALITGTNDRSSKASYMEWMLSAVTCVTRGFDSCSTVSFRSTYAERQFLSRRPGCRPYAISSIDGSAMSFACNFDQTTLRRNDTAFAG